jgi:hypothetical protein
MRTLISVLFILLASLPVFSQRKSKVDPKDAKIDSLTNATQTLTLQVDSLSAELVKYVSVYSVIKEKVIHYNFDPTRTSFLIDSLKAARDSAFARLAPSTQAAGSSDSIPILKNEIRMLKATINNMSTVGAEKLAALTAEEIEKAKAIGNLKQLKELFDAKIITEAEFIAAKKKYLDKL